MSTGGVILYGTEDGKVTIQLQAEDGTVWLSQAEISDLFDTTPQNITQHIKAIYSEKECDEEATCKDFLQVRQEGGRRVERRIQIYSLEVILAVGFRVRSPRGTQFRRWANTTLKEYLIKGFVMDDERLKNPQFDYFDELLERIRDIRASEARFYQKLRDILSLSDDYDPNSQAVQEFYATIQNKMLYAATSHTAAELIALRSDAGAPNMGLTSWKGQRVRKGDVATAKNYLGDPEIKDLNQIVTMFLDAADFRARRRQSIRLREWETVLDQFLSSNEMPVLRGNGHMTKVRAEAIAHNRYEEFNAARKAEERTRSEAAPDIDIDAALRDIEDSAQSARRKARSRPKS